MVIKYPVLITYHSTPSAAPYTLRILASLRAQLPFRNLHGKAAAGTGGARTSIRSIQELDIEFVSIPQADGLNLPLAKEVEHGSLVSAPLVHVLFVECDDSEVYKTSLRPTIKEWQRKLKDQTSPCLIVLITTSNSTGDDKKTSVFSNLKAQATSGGSSNILGKLKADFESAHRKDRCIQLSLPAPPANASATRLAQGLTPVSSISPSETSNYIELVNTLKDLLLVSFDIVIGEREESVKRGEAQRVLPGWSWGNWFLNKECLAYSYEAMHLLEDALIQYDELEASLVQVMRDGNAWIGKSGIDASLLKADQILPEMPSTSPSLAPPSTPRAPTTHSLQSGASSPSQSPLKQTINSPALYYEKIAASNFTVYDYRAYIFKRQAQLLGSLRAAALAAGREGEARQRTEEFGRRGEAFVVGTGKWLRENQGQDLESRFLVEGWMFDTAASLLATCEAWSSQQVANDGDPDVIGYLKLRPRILRIKVMQLDRIGVKTGFLPPVFPFLLSQDLLPQKNQILFEPGADAGLSPASPTGITTFASQQDVYPTQMVGGDDNSDQRTVLVTSQDRNEFYKLYTDEVLMAKAVEAPAGSRRPILELEIRLAELSFHRGHQAEALSAYLAILKAISAQLEPSSPSWQDIRRALLARALACSFGLELPYSNELLTLGFEYLACLSRRNQHGHAASTAGKEKEHVTLLSEKIVEGWVRGAWVQTTEVLEVHQYEGFNAELSSCVSTPLHDEDGCVIQARVFNHCPIEIQFADVRMRFSGRELEQLWFTSSATSLSPGWNNVSLTCLMPVSGLFRLEQSQLHRGNVIFAYAKTSASSAPVNGDDILRIPHDPGTLQATAQTPSRVSLQAQPRLEFRVDFGRNNVSKLKLAASGLDEAVQFVWQAAELLGDAGQLAVDYLAGGVSLEFEPNHQSGGQIVISVPYNSAARVDSLDVRVSVDYTTMQRPQLWRAYRSTQLLDLALPLAVNVQDFFRPEALISKFTISSVNGHILKLRSAVLIADKSPSRYKLQGCRKQPTILNIVPHQPVSCLFKVVQVAPESSNDRSDVLRLVLQYRTLDEEIRLSLRAVVHAALPASDSLLQSAVVDELQAVLDTTDRNQWLPEYLLTGRLRLPQIGNIALDNSSQSVQSKQRFEIGTLVKAAIEQMSLDGVVSRLELPWRTLDIPVEVPIMTIISSSRFRFLDDQPAVLGTPILVELVFKSSFVWASKTDAGREIRMMYDLVVEQDSWLISGVKRGTYSATASAPYAVRLCLIPMRHGHLLLPSVTTIPINRGDNLTSAENHQMDAAKRVLVYPIQRTSTFRILADGANHVEESASWQGERNGSSA